MAKFTVAFSMILAMQNNIYNALKVVFLLLLQALSCAQTLCKVNQQIAKSFVDEDIHILLFALLYKDDKEPNSKELNIGEPLEDTETRAENCKCLFR